MIIGIYLLSAALYEGHSIAFFNLKYFTSIPMRHGTIIANARIQNMPPSSPTLIVLLNINFAMKRMISRPKRINRKVRDFLT